MDSVEADLLSIVQDIRYAFRQLAKSPDLRLSPC